MHLKYKILIAVLAALVVILGAALITHLVLSGKEQNMLTIKPVSSGGMGRGMLMRELNLDAEQVRRFDSLREKFFESTSSLRDSLDIINGKIAAALGASQPNRQEILSWVQQESYLENRYKKMLVMHVLDLQQICTPEQREALSRFYPQLMGSGQGMGRGMMHRHRWGRQHQPQ